MAMMWMTFKRVLEEIAAFSVEAALYFVLSIVLAAMYALMFWFPLWMLWEFNFFTVFAGVLLVEIVLMVIKIMYLVHVGIRLR